jgi:hypothetical protein
MMFKHPPAPNHHAAAITAAATGQLNIAAAAF